MLLNRNMEMLPILIWKIFEKYRNSDNISNFKIIIILISIYSKRDFFIKKIEIKSRILFLEIEFIFTKF